MPTSNIGALIAPWHVEQAVIATIRAGLNTFLAEIERQSALTEGTLPRPPSASSYYGGVDFAAWVGSDTPAVIVNANPVGAPEFSPDAGYGQNYEVEIGAQVIGADEDDARMLAGLYAAAVAGTVGQNGGLSGLAGVQDTRLNQTAMVRLPDPDKRREALGVCGFHVFVQPVLLRTGPVIPTPVDSTPPPYPTVSHVETDFAYTRVDAP